MKLSKVSSRIATVVRSRRVPLKNNPRGYDAMVPRVVRLARVDLSVSRSSHASFRFRGHLLEFFPESGGEKRKQEEISSFKS